MDVHSLRSRVPKFRRLEGLSDALASSEGSPVGCFRFFDRDGVLLLEGVCWSSEMPRRGRLDRDLGVDAADVTRLRLRLREPSVR